MKFSITPFEERILLDAAGAANVVDSYALEQGDSDYAHDQTSHTDVVGAVHTNSDSVDGRVLVVSSQVKDSTLLADAAKDNIIVITYDFETPLAELAEAIGEALNGNQATSIGFALLGADGQFSITNDAFVSAQRLQSDVDLQTFWKDIGGMVQNGGSIDILACNISQSTNGFIFVQQLDSLVDNSDAGHYISINASTDKTGSSDLGGNWYLEVGDVNALDRYFDSTRIQNWQGLLDTPVQLIEINGGTASSSPSNFVQVLASDNSAPMRVYFLATTAANGRELWVTDGTAAGTYLVKDINPGTTSTTITNMVMSPGSSTNGYQDLYFIATVGTETALWKSDGTSAGTIQAANINTSGNDAVSGLVSGISVGGGSPQLFFAATTSATGSELYRFNTQTMTASLAYDARPGTTGSSPTQITKLNDTTMLFVANNGTNGQELMRFGGSGNGLVRDIRPGATGSAITQMTLADLNNGVVVFAANDGTNGNELWRSDGTTAGTFLVSNIVAGGGSSNPQSFNIAAVGTAFSTLYFTATSAAGGSEIWSYGLSSGNPPSQVADIVPGTGGSSPVFLGAGTGASAGFAAATTTAGGRELWRLSGGVGTQFDINPGTAASNPANFVPGWGNSSLIPGGAEYYFTATAASGGTELYAAKFSGGGSVVRIADIFPGTTGSNPTSITPISVTAGSGPRYLFFSATGSSATGAEFWVMDMNSAPTAANTSFSGTEDTPLTGNLKTNATDPDLGIIGFTESLSVVLVSGPTKGSLSLNASSGDFTYTPDANTNGVDTFTYRIQDSWGVQSAIYTATLNMAPIDDPPIAQNGSLTTGQGIYQFGQLVATDPESLPVTYSIVTGPAHGILNLNASTGEYTFTPDAGYYGTDSFTFRANDGALDIYSNTATIDITINQMVSPPQMLIDANTGSVASNASNFTQVGDIVYFTATTATHGTELWRSDGTTAGTFRVTDIFAGTSNSNPNSLVELGGDLYFIATSSASEISLWRYNGITASQISNIFASGNDNVSDLVKVGSYLYFSATNGATTGLIGQELWRYDGTNLVSYDIRPGTASSSPVQLSTDGTKLYFVATNGTNGLELFTLDGSGAPILVKDIAIGSGSSSIANLTVIDGIAYFAATDTTANGSELWKSDGTSVGTVMVQNINSALNASSTPSNFTSFNGKVYFTATTDANGLELWMTDGTSGGTALVKDIRTGIMGSFVSNLTVAGTNLFFLANDGVNGNELWVSDGTEIGTVLVTNINSGGSSSSPSSIVAIDNKVYFSANSGMPNGTELWVSDGTPEGTSMVMDINPGNGDSNPSDLKVVGSRIYFTATDGVYGSEAWVYDINIAPSGADTTFPGTEDTVLNGNVVMTDLNDNILGASLVTGPTKGGLVFNADGSFVYTPNLNTNGIDTFTYQIEDQLGAISPIYTVTLDIAPVNDAPTVPNFIFYSVKEGVTLYVNASSGVLNGVTDPEGNTPLTAELFEDYGLEPGTITVNPDGSFIFEPQSSTWTGFYTFYYTVTDSLGAVSAPKQAVIHVQENTPPTLGSNPYPVYQINQGDVLNGSGLLVGATDVNGNPIYSYVDPDYLVLPGVSQTINPDGTFTFTTPDYGRYTIGYYLTDGPLRDAFNPNYGNGAYITVLVDGVMSTNEDTAINGFLTVFPNDGIPEITGYTQPTYGSLTIINAFTGEFIYTPDANYFGTDSFTYQSDGVPGFQTINLTINPVNDAPVGITYSYNTTENTQLNVPAGSGLLVGATDVEGDTPYTIQLVSNGSKGSVIINNDGSFTYTPNVGENGADTFTYTITDSEGGVSAILTADILINDAPIPSNPALSTDEDTPFIISPSTLGTDINGNSLTINVISGPSNGTLISNGNGTYTFTPDANYHGTDSFTYTLNDGYVDSVIGTANLTITAVNDAPVAQDGVASTDEDNPVTGNLVASDVDLDGLTYSIVTGPAHGSINLNSATGEYTYTPDLNYNGSDSFTFKVNDGNLDSNVSVINITINAVNDAPVPPTDALNYTTDEDTTLNGSGLLTGATDVEGDTLTAVLDGAPAHGSVTVNPNGTFIYTPDANFNGTDSFTYVVNDGNLNSVPKTVFITINAVNDAPTAVGASETTAEDTPFIGNLSASDIESSPLTYSIVSGPSHGSIDLNALTGEYTYTPALNYNGSDSFTFQVNDGSLDSNVAVINLTITPVNDAPVAQDGVASTDEDNPVTGNLVASDVDLDGLTFSIVTGPAHGSINLNAATGEYTYTPDLNYNGSDSFTFKVNDGSVDSNVSVINITINAVNDAPVPPTDALNYSTDEDTTLNGSGLLTGATDVEGDTLTAVLEGAPAHGSVTVNPNGTFIYTPDANFNGTDSFTYVVNDGNLNSAPKTVFITIDAVNDAPTAVGASETTAEDTPLLGNLSASDIESSPLTYSIVSGPSHGSINLNALTGEYTYTPALNYNGSDSFTFQVNDGSLDSNVAVINLTITPVNDAPVAQDGVASTDEDNPVTGNLIASDVDLDGLTFSIVTGPAHGSINLNAATGEYTYTPDLNYNGSDSFTFKVNDGNLDSNVSVINITINAVNDAPVPPTDALNYSTDEDTTLNGSGLLIGATDVEGDTLTAVLDGAPAHGSVTVNPNGTFIYTPDANFNGTDSFTYVVNDGNLNSAPKTVFITIDAVNDAPTAVGASASTAEDTPLNGNLSASDIESSPLTYSIVSGPSHGSINLNALTGEYTYTPALNYNGSDSFTFQVNDGSLDSNVAVINLTITPVNDAPVSQDGVASTDEDNPVTGNLVASDVDLDGLTFSIVSGPAHGSINLNANTGEYTYTPNANYNGTDSFTFQVSDGNLDSNVSVINITINAVNDAPVPPTGALNYTTDEDTTLNGSGLLTGATDVEGDTLTAVLDGAPAHGSVTVNPDGTFIYIPDANFNGTDSFTYVVNDGNLDSAPKTVFITIDAVNDAPTAVGASASTAEDTPLVGNLSASDIESSPLTYSIVSGPLHGSINLNTATGEYTYTPALNYNGSDSFTFQVNDGSLDSNVAVINLTITPVNDAPVAQDGIASTDEDNPVTGNLVASDVDLDGLTYSIVTGPAHGSINLNANTGEYTYTPNANYNGTDSFTFQVSDGNLNSNVSVINITINAVNDAPVPPTGALNYTTDEDTTLNGSGLLTGATDVEGDSLITVLNGAPTHGSVTVNPDGTFTYTPNANFNGTDSFTYVVNDGNLDSTPKTVFITIDAVNDAPTAVGASASTAEDTPLNGNLSASDIESSPLTYSIVSGPLHGSINLNAATGEYTYTPALNYNGSDSFTFQVNDGSLDSNVAVINLTINPVNDAPVAQDGVASTDEDNPVTGNLVASDVDLDGLTFSIVSGPAHGSINLNANTGEYTYTPALNYNGSDSFTFKVNDGNLDSNVSVINITVNPINDAPVAEDGAISLNEDTSVSGAVTFSDVDTPANQLAASIVSGPSHGFLSLNADGTFTYTPNANYNGNDSFTYKVNDGALDSGVQTFNININPVNDAPVAQNASFTVDEDTQLSGSVSFSDIDNLQTQLTASIVSGPAHGSVSFQSDGSFIYTPTANFNGVDSFTYKVSDGLLDSGTQTVLMTVNPINDAPFTQDQHLTMDVNTTISSAIQWGDVDSSSVTASLVSAPSNGTLVLNPDGSFTYTPNNSYVGTDAFSFVVSDGQLNSLVKQVTIDVNPPAPEPPPVEETASVPLDSQNQQEAPTVEINVPIGSFDTTSPENSNEVTEGGDATTIYREPEPSTNTPQTLNTAPAELNPLQLSEESNNEIKSGSAEEIGKSASSGESSRNQTIENAGMKENELLKKGFVPDNIENDSEENDKDVRPRVDLNIGAQEGLLLIPKEMFNVATIREKTTFNNKDLDRIILLIGPVVDNVDYCAKQSLGNLLNAQSNVRALNKDRRKIRKINLISNILESLDLSYARESNRHVAREKLKASDVASLQKAIDLSQFGDEYLDSYVDGLQELCETKFPADQYNIKEALAVELLTKYIVAQTLPEGFMFPFPYLQKNGRELTIHYSLTKTMNLGNSEIPVYIFEAAEKGIAPLLVYRATKLNFDKVSDAHSIVENFNAHGPARGYYNEFAPELKRYFDSRFNQSINSEKFRVFGYSQGGVLGQRTVIDFPEYVQHEIGNHSIFFNSPGIEKDYLEKWNNLNPENQPAVINYVITKDPVSKVGAGFIGDIFEITPNYEHKVTEAHFGVRFLEDGWKIFKVDGERESESNTRKILNAIQSSVITSGIYQLASMRIESMYAASNRNFAGSKGTAAVGKNFSLNKRNPRNFTEITGGSVALLSDNQQYTILQNGVLAVSRGGLLSLYPNPIGDVTVILDAKPRHGVLNLRLDGAFDYTPTKGYHGKDSFRVRIDDNGIISEPVEIDITIREANNPLPHMKVITPKVPQGSLLDENNPDITKVFNAYITGHGPYDSKIDADNFSEIDHDKIVKNASITEDDQKLALEILAATTLLPDIQIQKNPEARKPAAKETQQKHSEKGLYNRFDITVAVIAVHEDLRVYMREDLGGDQTNLESSVDQITKAIKEEQEGEHWR